MKTGFFVRVWVFHVRVYLSYTVLLISVSNRFLSEHCMACIEKCQQHLPGLSDLKNEIITFLNLTEFRVFLLNCFSIYWLEFVPD